MLPESRACNFKCFWAEVIGADALRMRLRRLCEKKRSGKCHVSDAVREDFIAGGEKRELLEVALLEVLQSTGLDRTAQKKIRLQFAARVLNVKERMQEREKEVTGQWLTAERMRTQLTYNEQLELKSGVFEAD